MVELEDFSSIPYFFVEYALTFRKALARWCQNPINQPGGRSKKILLLHRPAAAFNCGA